MKKMFCVTVVILVLCTSPGNALNLDDIARNMGAGHKKGHDSDTTVSGLKEALAVGTDKAVKNVSQVDGYFRNQVIKIPLPKEIKSVADALKKMGFQKQVDEFILSMNRGAEKAAPQAVSIFAGAIKEMTFVDAGRILTGGDTAATDYFKAKTRDNLYNAFKPVISSSMNDVGATRAYKEMMAKSKSVPFLKKVSFDLDKYVTDKAMDGLFYMVGQEEKKIRTDPAARVTDLLKTVFGK